MHLPQQQDSKMLLLALFGLQASALGAPWKPAYAPLSTKWTKDVTPDQVPEYPRPQLTRGEASWQHLNGLWQAKYDVADFTQGYVAPPFGKDLQEQILVPYPIESALSGIRAITTNDSMFYRRVFTADELLPQCTGRRLLHFEKSDWNTTVWANQHLLGNHVGGYDPFSFELPAFSDASGMELIVGVYDATDGNPNHDQSFGKQSRSAFDSPSGFMYTGSSGMWDTVWLECVPLAFIADLSIVPDFDSAVVDVAVYVNYSATGLSASSGFDVSVTVMDGTEVVANQTGHIAPTASAVYGLTEPQASAVLKLSLPQDFKHWSPSSPFLYNLTVSLAPSTNDDTDTDSVESYFGMRKISVSQVTTSDGRQIPAVMLNNKPFYQVGVLDQGWFPDGLYAAATDEALQSDLLALKTLGFNAIRKHQKVDTRRWYYHVDTMGFLVWQDMPQNTENHPRTRFLGECATMADKFKNSPALVMWVGTNEGWGEDSPGMSNTTTELFQSIVKDSRLVDDASGGRGFGCEQGWIDPEKDNCTFFDKFEGKKYCNAVFWTGGCEGSVTDHHNYPEPETPFDLASSSHLAGRPFLQGEYGGYSMWANGHLWDAKNCDRVSSSGALATYHRYGMLTSRLGADFGEGGDMSVHEKPMPSSSGTKLPDKDFTEAFVHYNKLAEGLLRTGLGGQIFTQITDIECECNGLLTYDRVPKADFEKVAAANAALLKKAADLKLHDVSFTFAV